MSNDTFLIEMGQKIRVARKAKKIPIDMMAELTRIDMESYRFWNAVCVIAMSLVKKHCGRFGFGCEGLFIINNYL